MKGKKIWKRILVAALAMSLALPNVSVAAQDGGMPTIGIPEVHSSQTDGGSGDIAAYGDDADGMAGRSVPTAGADGTENGTSEGEGQGEAQPPVAEGERSPVVESGEQPPAGDSEMPPESGQPPVAEGEQPSAEEPGVPSEPEGEQPSTGEPGEPSEPEGEQPPAEEPGAPSEPEGEQPSTGEPGAPSEPEGEQPPAEEPGEPSEPEGEQPSTGEPEEPSTGDSQEPEENPDMTLEPKEDDEDAPSDSGNFIDSDMSIPDLEALPSDQVGAAVQRCNGVDFYGVAPEDSVDEGASDGSWRFNAYYVNQPDDYDVEKDDDFSLKYQIEFHTDAIRAPGEVEIRIPAQLFCYRGAGDQIDQPTGRSITPSQIAVPKGEGWEEGQYTKTKNSPFNYRIDAATGDIVFFNYREISAGSNAAWQVLYENLDIMEIPDGTEWSLQPVAKVSGQSTTSKRTRPLTGRTHSGVVLNSVSKTPYQEIGKIYTPLLYTQAQVERYLDGALPSEYAGENFGNWKFAVWRVQVSGTANQPWDMVLREAPVAQVKNGGSVIPVQGALVGYRDDASQASGYNVSLQSTDSSAGTVVSGCKEEVWGSRFYVVTAYPARVDAQGRPSGEGGIELKEEDILENTLTVEIQPVDGGDSQQGSDTARVVYESYQWDYQGNAIGIKKASDLTKKDDAARSHKDYKSWWEAYWQSAQRGQDYGDLEFYTEGEFRGYDYTHVVSSDEGNGEPVGKYRTGTCYELITVDDFMYAQAYSKVNGVDTGAAPIPIGKEDYYYSAVTVTQTDKGYDISEEQYDLPEFPGEIEGGIDRAVHIYAMFAKSKAADGTYVDNAQSDVWEEVAIVPWNSSGIMTYTFTQEDIQREPWRIKAVHKTVEYSTTCNIDVKVRLRAEPSGAFKAFLEQYTSGGTENLTYVKLEDLSGVMGAHYQDGVRKGICHNASAGNVELDQDGKVTEPGDANYQAWMYGASQVAQESWNLYGGEYCDQDGIRRLPQRDNASVSLYGAYKEAQAFKEAAISNDAVNGRMVVDYFLTAYDGYQVYDQDGANYLSSMEGIKSPGNKYVTFYDLLPYGMYFDPSAEVVAGRLTKLDDKGYYKTQTNRWDEKGVSVSVDAETDIIEDWNGTGRTMLVFHIAYDGGDPSVYTGGKWMEGWGLSFRAYCQWKDMDSVKSQYNASAFMPDAGVYAANGTQTPILLGGAGEVYPDDGHSYPGGEAYEVFRKAGTGLNPANNGSTLNVLFADKRIEGDIAIHDGSKIEKQVHADDDTFNDFGESAYVGLGEDYTYRISMEVSSGKDVSALKDIVVFDHLENASVERAGDDFNDSNKELMGDLANHVIWHGVLRGVDLDWLKGQEWEIEADGDSEGTVRVHILPKVWYNAARNATTTNWNQGEGDSGMTFLTGSGEENALEDVLTAQNGWYGEEEYISQYKEALDEAALSEKIAAYKERNGARMAYVITEYRKAYPNANGTDEDIADAAVTRALALETVGSIAVDLRKCVDAEGKEHEFILRKDESLTFQVRMTATDDEGCLTTPRETGADGQNGAGYKVPYAFNNPAFYSCAVATGTKSTVAGDSVRVTIGSRKNLEIEKRLSGSIPAQARDTDFRFRVYRQGGEALSNRAYTLWNWAEDSASEEGGSWVQDTSRLYATDAEGYLTLKGGQKAFFGDLPDADVIRVEEEGNIFWRAEYGERTSREEGDSLTYTQTVTNHYRPVLYVRKRLGGVPESKLEEVEDSVFTMQITREGKRGELDYCQVDALPGSGKLPQIIGEQKRTVNGGQFRIKESEIIAVFLDAPGTKYELREIMDADDGKGQKVGDNWICQNPCVAGSIPYDGAVQTIMNHYMWKNLYLTKKIAGKELDEEESRELTFKFQVCRLEEGEDGESVETPLPEGTAWTIVDADGNAVPEEEGGASGVLDGQGMFQAACVDRTVRIEGLKADCTYVVREIVEPDADYIPENAEKEIWMPVYGSSQKAEFVNVYQWSSLRVSKDVVSVDQGSEEDAGSAQFKMVIAERTEDGRYRILRNRPYVLRGQETEETVEELTRTDGYGIFTLRRGDTAVFEDLGRIGTEYLVWEIQDSAYMQIFPVSGDMETVAFADGSVMEEIEGDSGKAVLRIAPDPESQDKEIREVIVGAPAKAELAASGTDADFINGDPGALLLGKEYVPGPECYPADEIISGQKQYLGESQNNDDGFGGGMARAANTGGRGRDEDYLHYMDIDANAIWQEILEFTPAESPDEEAYLADRWIYFEEHLGRRWDGRDDECNWDVKVQIEADGAPYEIDRGKPLVCIDNLSGLKYTLEYRQEPEGWYLAAVDGISLAEHSRQVRLYDEAGNLIVHPWMTYVLDMDPSTEYSVKEVDCEFDTGFIIAVPKYPSAGESVEGKVESNPAVTLCNEVRFTGKLIEKRMTPDSAPVGVGKTLVWRVERYDTDAGEWVPAEGIGYCIVEQDPIGDYAYINFAEIQKTGKDGKIRLSRSKDTDTPYLAVQFLDSEIYLNLETALGEDTLRVVELWEESDAAWGVLAGYGMKDIDDYYSMDLDASDACAFVNSNSTFPVEVQKLADTGAEDTFTMILKRGVYESDNSCTFSPYGGMPYTVYQEDEATGETKEVRSDVTTDKGEIFLRKGQYARMNLTTEFEWTVSEDIAASPNYELVDMVGERDRDHIFTKQEANSMLIVPGGTGKDTTTLTAVDVRLGVYDENGNHVELNEGDVTIPQYIMRKGRKLKVVGIDSNAFQECMELTGITIPDGVETIGEAAFRYAGLEKVVIGNGVKEIEEWAFGGCIYLAEIEIGTGVERIGAYAFYGSGMLGEDCNSVLTSVRIPDNVKVIGAHAFEGCVAVEKIAIGTGVESIGEYAFGPWRQTGSRMVPNDSLKEIFIPGNVKEIGEGAFYCCVSLKEIVLGEGVQTIGEKAFAGDKITNLPYKNASLTEITIPASVTKIGSRAFQYCDVLEKVTFSGEGLPQILERAFYMCSKAMKFVVGETTIDPPPEVTGNVLP